MSNTKDTPARQPSFYRSPSNDYEEGYRDAKKEMDALKLELQKQKVLKDELVNALKWLKSRIDNHDIMIKSTSARRFEELESLIKKSNEI